MKPFDPHDFEKRHIGTSPREEQEMLKACSISSKKELLSLALSSEKEDTFKLPPPLTEKSLNCLLSKKAKKNKLFKTFIGRGYKASFLPPVIRRNVLENPVWLTSYTPYQSELSQGRLEALLNFQTMVSDLTGLEISQASLLDEGTALAEALSLSKNVNDKKQEALKFFVDQDLFPQNKEVLKTRSKALGFEMEIGDFKSFSPKDHFAVLIQYPNSKGLVEDLEEFLQKMKKEDVISIVSSDLLSLTLIKSPGEMGADIVVGNSGNFGIPYFFGGPHAGFLATRKKWIRQIPGRIVGVSKNRHGKNAYRLTLQTREQHIRRERATSNICTAQALLATTSSFYGVYHGPLGLKAIALKINNLTKKLRKILKSFPDLSLKNKSYFDTLSFSLKKEKAKKLYEAFLKEKINVFFEEDFFSLTLDETCNEEDLIQIKEVLKSCLSFKESKEEEEAFPEKLLRKSEYMTHPVFNMYHSETKLLRYIHSLQDKELSLTHSMIPLGSCTMKLNATSELEALSMPEFANLHPFIPLDQSLGIREIISELNSYLCELTGFSEFNFQGNAGSQGEYAGLLAIKNYFQKKKEERKFILIPSSAHGTNPASAIMAGFKVLSLKCLKDGSIDKEDLTDKIKKHGKNLAGAMFTYPSTYGFFEEGMSEICKALHDIGALIYLDGANMNALLGLIKPQKIGFDICHLNLHKTFCIPHGGGGPGVGPVGVRKGLEEFLPSHIYEKKRETGSISSAPFGSAILLIISWSYIRLMGEKGLRNSALQAILSANYMAKRLEKHFKILFSNKKGFVAHELIIDLKKFKNQAGITVEDVVKRLIDYSFHAPTMSWPEIGTLMIEPTESESKDEIDKFLEALISIKKEMDEAIKEPKNKEILKNAPHVMEDLIGEWKFPYTQLQAFYPLKWLKQRKFMPPTSRIENASGDITPFCSCPPMDLD